MDGEWWCHCCVDTPCTFRRLCSLCHRITTIYRVRRQNCRAWGWSTIKLDEMAPRSWQCQCGCTVVVVVIWIVGPGNNYCLIVNGHRRCEHLPSARQCINIVDRGVAKTRSGDATSANADIASSLISACYCWVLGLAKCHCHMVDWHGHCHWHCTSPSSIFIALSFGLLVLWAAAAAGCARAATKQGRR